MVRVFLTLQGLQEASVKKRVTRDTPRVGHVHNTRCFVNTDQTYTVALMGLSPYRVRIAFEKAMPMVNRCDSRSYAQVVSQPCASNFSYFPSMVNNKGLHYTQVSCHTIHAENTVQTEDKTVPYL